jgi:hypothetical protein
MLDHEATHRYSSSFMKPLRGEKPPLAWRRSKHDACPNKFGRLQKTKAIFFTYNELHITKLASIQLNFFGATLCGSILICWSAVHLI